MVAQGGLQAQEKSSHSSSRLKYQMKVFKVPIADAPDQAFSQCGLRFCGAQERSTFIIV
jgi:hypothetical protein